MKGWEGRFTPYQSNDPSPITQTVHHNVLWLIWYKLCQYRQHKPPIQTEQSSYRIPSWLTFSKAALKSICTILASPMHFECMRPAQMCITCSQTFLISKLCVWKHTTTFHKSSEMNWHQTLKHVSRYCCDGSRSVTGNRRGLRVRLACSIKQGNYPGWKAEKTLHKAGVQDISSFL